MIVFPCTKCQTSLSANEAHVGMMVRCPACQETMQVPAPGLAGASKAPGVSRSAGTYNNALTTKGSGRRDGFPCVYCSSKLEATESMAAQDGQCPTCGNNITIPILDRYGRLIDPKTQEVLKLPPHPVHAYAAAGDRALRIQRDADNKLSIICPRCNTRSPISANNCRACAMPFTMEGTSVEASGASNGWCVASLAMGIIGIPGGCLVVFPVLAIIFGGIGYSQVASNQGTGGGKGLAVAGMICGVIGGIIGLMYWSNR